MYCDYHVHTNYSDDSTYLMEDVIKDAIKMKMDEICFTDHVDYGIKKDWDEGPIEYLYGQPQVNVDYPKYFKEIESLRKKYPNITIRQGMEFGVQVHTIPRYQKLYEQYDFDFIILSIHQVNNQEFWTQDYQKEKSQQEYIEGYYQEMLNVVKKYKNYSVLGHLDLMTRYDEIGNYPFDPHHPAGQASAGRSELLGSTFLLKERTTEGHDSAGKQQKDDYINDMHTDRAFKVSTPDKKGVPPTPCVSSRVPEH